ncbi:MAG: 23S rRNA (guanosine(2251)-2'-O)-methyltransferase RlmB [Nitrospinae bacterium CG11_big_fil_rev_8_21_14_0_20_56_8]|nr:MAG: 23S rRNA (guanosine(2251)-2'-O)-methyltransferase RlmB [Nitrospinae bacterium CG11_big_fil_rev_8_21_14_0_20_56_8]
MNETHPQCLFGIHPVLEALKTGQRRFYKIVIAKEKSGPKFRALLDLARTRNVRVELLPRSVFDQKYRSFSHQGVVGYVSVKETLDLPQLVAEARRASSHPVLVLLDELQDPHNVGAIIRSAEGLGLQGVVVTKHRAAPLGETVAKCSAGALERLPVACVTNLARAMENLKQDQFWIVGLDRNAEHSCHGFHFPFPCALVIGGEERGIRPGLKKLCDFMVSIPMAGTIDSLNASAAAAVIFYEVLRQRKSHPSKP